MIIYLCVPLCPLLTLPTSRTLITNMFHILTVVRKFLSTSRADMSGLHLNGINGIDVIVTGKHGRNVTIKNTITSGRDTAGKNDITTSQNVVPVITEVKNLFAIGRRTSFFIIQGRELYNTDHHLG